MDSSRLQINIEETFPPVISAIGELDYQNCDSLASLITGTICKCGPTMKLSLGGLEFVDSSGLRILVKAAIDAKKTGGSVTVVSLTRQLKRMLEISGFQHLFEITATSTDPTAVESKNLSPAPTCCFELPSGMEICGIIRNKVCCYAGEMGCDPLILDDVRLAVGEAVSNAVRHGACNGDNIEVNCSTDNGRLIVTLKYLSEPFDPHAVPIPNPDLTPEGGMGIHFMKLVMDKVDYNYDNGYLTIKLEKQLTVSAHSW